MASLSIEYVSLSSLQRWPRNPKEHDVGAIYGSISRFGYVQPILIDEKSGRIVAGHGRLDTLQHMQQAGENPPERIEARDGDWFVPVIRGIEFQSDVEAESYLVADNRLTILGGWNDATLADVLKDLHEHSTLHGIGYDVQDLAALLTNVDGAEVQPTTAEPTSTLAERFVVPPFSVLDARQGYWNERKRLWLDLGIQSEIGRGDNLLKMSRPNRISWPTIA